MATTEKKPTASPSKRAKDRREQQLQQQKRNQQLLLGILAVAFLIGVVAVLVITIQANQPQATIASDIKTRYAPFQAQNLQGVTDAGFPYLGAANAPSTLEEFGSFSCPHCAEFHDSIFVNLLDEIQAGRVKVVFIPITNIGAFNAQPETEAAICVAQQGKFWEMNDVLFSWQGLYGTGANDPARLSSAAKELGLDVDKYNSCLSAGTGKQVVEKAAEDASKRNVNVTPTVFFNGQQISPDPKTQTSPTLSQYRGLIEAAATKKS